MSKPLFNLGQTVATPGALAVLAKHGLSPLALLARHLRGDWGDMDAHDKRHNDLALKDGSRIFSGYKVGDGKIWVITEAVGEGGQRASTCLLKPDEY